MKNRQGNGHKASRSRLRQIGQGMTEYIIIVALIAIAAIAVYQLFGQTVRGQVSGMAGELSGGDGSAGQAAAAGAATASEGEATAAKGLTTYKEGNTQ